MVPPDAADPVARVTQFAALMLELAGAGLVTGLLMALRRSDRARDAFALWSRALGWITAALVALAIRYVLIGDRPTGGLPDDHLLVAVLYAGYQFGKFAFFSDLLTATQEYVAPRSVPRSGRLGLAAALLLAVVSAAATSDLTMLVVWQAVPGTIALGVALAAMLQLPAARRSFGTRGLTAAIGLLLSLWATYLVVFSVSRGLITSFMPRIEEVVLRYNSFADTFSLIAFGFAVIVLYLEGAQQRARASEARLAAILEGASDAVITLDLALVIVEMNGAAERLFGVHVGAVRGRPISELVVGADLSQLEGLFRTPDPSERRSWRLTGETIVRARRQDGVEVPVDGTLTRPHGDGATLALVLHDISGRLAVQERHVQREKMQAVRQLAGGLAHDFLNLATAIGGRSQLLARSLAPGSQARQDAEEIELMAGSAVRVTRQLQALSLRAPLHAHILPMNAAVRACETRVRELVGPAVSVGFRYVEDAGAISVDADRFRDVLLSLVQNAREALGANPGRIGVETSRHSRVEPDGTTVVEATLTVRDTGPGLSEAARAHLFEPFYSTKGEGRGLGLATAYGFAQQSGGRIDVESGTLGTAVTIALPVVEGHAVVPLPTARAVPSGLPTVLIAEDEESVRRFLRIVLEREGFEVLTGTNGAEALRLWEGAKSPIGLVLTDVVMPQLDGLEMVTQMRRVRPDQKVVFMSGFMSDRSRLAKVLGRPAPFLQKPFDLGDLLRLVREEFDRGGEVESVS